MHKRKLIEVALPLEAINLAAAAEKSRKVGKPQQIHHWWARRPITSARALLFAQLVDDPASRPDLFPSDAEQVAERARLHDIIARLARWEAADDQSLLKLAQEEIRRSADGALPAVIDPFAGGGAIPLEAQRLGLVAYATDLNPVAVLVNKALLELPSRFEKVGSVHPDVDDLLTGQSAQGGLARDVQAYGEWILAEASRRLDKQYPKVQLPDGGSANVISWLWARTVPCPNPACGIHAPLVKSWRLSTAKGRDASVVPRVAGTPGSGARVEFAVEYGRGAVTEAGVVGRKGTTCLACETAITLEHIRAHAVAGTLGTRLMAIVAEGQRKRLYVSPTREHEEAARIERPAAMPTGTLSTHPQYMGAPRYGMTEIPDLFTNRQLVALTTFCDLVATAREAAFADATESGMPEGSGLEAGGNGARAYSEAISVYLALAVSRLADWSNSLCRWDPKAEVSQQLFGLQTVNMSWDFSEARTTSPKVSGSFGACLTTMLRSLRQLRGGPTPVVEQRPAGLSVTTKAVLNTDPPYYDNVPYADLSDFFYAWLRFMLRPVYPSLFSTILVPKSDELVADYVRHQGKAEARDFFESGFREVFKRAHEGSVSGYPILVYYAFRQSDSDEGGEASTGWETLLEGMISSGWEITATWPIRSEHASRVRSQGSNVLASSIVLALTQRPDGAGTIDRRGFIELLRAELPVALRRLQQGVVAPVDLPQAAIGPGMAVFSRYNGVLESEGSRMTVRAALARINEILDQVLNEQEGDFDPTTRFAIAWYRQHGYGVGQFGDADNLARARNTSVAVMDRDEILTSRGGNVQLIKPANLSWDYDVLTDAHTSNWEALHHLIKVLERDGIAPAGDFLQAALSRPDGAVDAGLVMELAHLLFRIAEGNGWTKDALSLNALVTSWPEIFDVARAKRGPVVAQGAFEFDEENE